MNRKLFPVLLATSMMWGCASARMYPVRGPLASESPQAVYPAKITGLLYSGDIKVTVAIGELCKGHWTLVKGGNSADATPSGATEDSSVAEGMPAAWDTVYGQGYYVGHVLGQRLYAHAMVTGNHGTILNVEFYRLNNATNVPSDFHGVAKDNRGDIFKLAF
jgi:hypothetical protein